MSKNPFLSVGGGSASSLQQAIGQLRANPMQILGRKWNIPQGVNMSDPNSILQHLVSTGQISQQQYNAAFQQAQKMKMK